MTKRGKKTEIEQPTTEQLRHGQYVEQDIVDRLAGKNLIIGKAWRRKPMVDLLAAQGYFSDAEYKALRQYRHFASLADKSPLRDSLNRTRGGGNHDGPTVEVLTATWAAAACESAAGSLAAILRAVIVDDISLSQWAIIHGGAVETCRDRKGRRICVIEPKRKAMEIAQLDIKMAAKRVEAEIGA